MSVFARQASTLFYSNLKFRRKCRTLEIQMFSRYMCDKPSTDISKFRDSKPYKTVRNKVANTMQWYEEFTGLKEVRMAQCKVLEAGEKLVEAQEERRQASLELLNVQKKLKELYAELDVTKRSDERYIHLVTEEHKLLKFEELCQERFKESERAEREQFNLLTNAVQVSHEKERSQSEKTKYWSVIGSVIGTLLGVLGTSINNYFKMSELKEMIRESSALDFKEQLKSYMEKSEQIFNNVSYSNLSSNNRNSEINKSLEDLLEKLNTRISDMEGSVKKIESNNSPSQIVIDPKGDSSELLILHLNSITESIQNETSQIKVLLLAASVVCILAPIITKIVSGS